VGALRARRDEARGDLVRGGIQWCVYMLRCRDDSLYVGMTNDLWARVDAHDTGRGAKYTRGRGPVEVVWLVPCDSRSDALRVEASVKKLSRARRLALVPDVRPSS
jgi:putative endonuclease